MITYYRNNSKNPKLEELSTFQKGCWVHVVQPDADELERLSSELGLEESLLKDALDPYEVPRVEEENKVMYFYTRVPYRDRRQVLTTPVLVVSAGTFIMTITQRKLPIWDRLIGQKITFYTTHRTQFFFHIFNEITKRYTSFVTEIRKEVQKATASFGTIGNKEIVRFVRFESTLNSFLSALTPTNTSLKNLMSGKYLKLYDEDENFIEDILLSNEQLIESCKTNLKAISNIRDAYSTIMTNNLNRVIKILTVITIVLTIPTMVASFYGMNVDLPGSNNPEIFWFIAGGAVFVALLMLLVFYLNDWLQ